MSWEYDADGNRTGFTDTTGITTTYTHDAAGRVKTVRNSRLGEAAFTHDTAGRLTAVTAGDLVQEWVYRNGYLSEHTRTNRAEANGGTDITLIGRDGDGRITGLTRGGTVTRYGYDGAGQLVAAATTASGQQDTDATVRAQVSEWEYDAGGRLVREFTPAGPRTYAYDLAGQLVAVAEADGSRTEYVYDGLGRRSRLIGADGSWTEYAWGETGYLQSTVDRTPDGMETDRGGVTNTGMYFATEENPTVRGGLRGWRWRRGQRRCGWTGRVPDQWAWPAAFKGNRIGSRCGRIPSWRHRGWRGNWAGLRRYGNGV